MDRIKLINLVYGLWLHTSCSNHKRGNKTVHSGSIIKQIYKTTNESMSDKKMTDALTLFQTNPSAGSSLFASIFHKYCSFPGMVT